MNSNILVKLINKYYIDGNVESVIWKIDNNKLIIKFITNNKDLVGTVICDSIDINNCKLAIYNTTQLKRLLKVFDNDDVQISIISKSKINFKSNDYDLLFQLADEKLIQDVPEVQLDNNYDIEFNLSSQDIKNIRKANDAIKEDTVVFSIGTNIDTNLNNNCVITFGKNTDYSNLLSYSVNCIIHTHYSISYQMPFDSNMFCSILSNCNGETKIKINSGGLMYIYNKEDNITCEYFFLRKAEL